jgi:hypothetical protein
MHKILFAKNMIGEEAELLEFIEKRFDVLVLSIAGTQLGSAKNSIEYTHKLGSKIYFRSIFVHTAQMSELVSRVETLFENGADGYIFHGHTTDKDSDELMLRFSELAASLSEKEIIKPIVFMVDQFAGNINLIQKLQKLLNRDDFPKNLDIRVAVRVSTRTIGGETTLPKADLHVIDFLPLDNQAVYQRVVSLEKSNKLDVVAYMTFDNMSDDLRKAIKDYGKPAPQEFVMQGPQTVTVIHDLTLRDSPSGLIIRRDDKSPVSLAKGEAVKVLDSGYENNNLWYKVDFSGNTGWIAGKIGNIEYAK